VFSHHSIHNYTWTSDGKIHNQIDHVLIDKRQRSNIVSVQSFGVAECDIDHYLVVAKVGDLVSKRAA
jgi:hypothetical protein